MAARYEVRLACNAPFGTWRHGDCADRKLKSKWSAAKTNEQKGLSNIIGNPPLDAHPVAKQMVLSENGSEFY